MKRNRPGEVDLELFQHETTRTLHWFDVDRRRFLRILGGGVLVCAAAPPLSAQESRGRERGGPELPREISSWIHIGADGRVTVFTGKVEMGQNIRTSLSQQVAEELRAPVASITLVMGDTDRTPFDMGTFGSRTTPTMGPQLRKMAAAARQTLVEIAAQRWRTSPAALEADGGRVVNASTGRASSYGELTEGKNLVKVVSAETELTPAARWKVAGTPVRKVDARDFVTGRHAYTSDLARPGMLYGKILRPAGFHAELLSLETKSAEAISGVRVVRDGNFVGVVAPDESAAERALSALKAQWKVGARGQRGPGECRRGDQGQKTHWVPPRVCDGVALVRTQKQGLGFGGRRRNHDFGAGRYSGGIGRSGRSASHVTDAIHHRFPSRRSWIELMPRWNGFGSDAACRDSYVEKTWQTLPKQSVRRAISFSKKPAGSPPALRASIPLRARSANWSTSSATYSGEFPLGGMSIPV